ncbi:hypothetical protein K469DRAFT_699718 [Zopfia rhizophila CBS 207.26]|uniref:BED-type domain-containing protein n=1 Tax=Zopfia rhizophila CBS 207.26 TaxID=1314779 RepID=A0A6A6EHP4_9PEZI|nr:hypothetical protein K469DRAFT_699718 [Zopfia rhizophila CBS 207.26]
MSLHTGGKAYIRCKHLTKTPAQIRRRKSPIWQWGEDIVAKDQPTSDRLFYCYLCEKKGAYQELMKIADGNTTALNHLAEDHNMDRYTGKLENRTRPPPSQPTLREAPGLLALNWQRNWDAWKLIFVRWIVYCHIAFY